MKLLLTALCASFIALPAFAEDCEKCPKKSDKEKKQDTVAHCGKCEGDKKKDCDKCDKDKKKEGTLAHCGKCEGDKKKDCDKCDKDKKKEGTLA